MSAKLSQSRVLNRPHTVGIIIAIGWLIVTSGTFSGSSEISSWQDPMQTINAPRQSTKSTGPGRISPGFLRARIFISADGETLVTGVGTPKCTVTTWRTSTWKQFASVDIGNSVLVAATSDVTMIATAEIDKTTVVVRETMSGKEIRSLMTGPAPQAHPTKTYTAVAFSNKLPRLVTAPFSRQMDANLWDTTKWNVIESFAHSCRGEGVVFSPDDRQLAVWGWFPEGNRRPHMAEIWRVDPPTLQSRMVDDDRLTSLAFAPDGTRVVTGNSRGLVHVWMATTGRKIFEFEAHGNRQFLQVTYSPNGDVIATGSSDGTAKLWDSTDGRHIHTFTHSEPIDAVAFFPGGKKIAVADAYGVLKIWEVPQKCAQK